MNKVSAYFAFILATLYMIGCSGLSKEQKQNKELEKLALEVMEVHDRSMPNHGKLFGLKKKLFKIQECYKDSAVLNEVNETLLDIEMSDKDMMDWMHTYQAPEDFLPFEEKKAYYIEEKKAIENVESFMNQTMSNANQLINTYPIKKECTGF